MAGINLIFAWGWITLGLLSGAVQGVGFHHESWMGGYHSWRRRLTRLGHIAFLGTGMLNIAMALTVMSLGIPKTMVVFPGGLLIMGALSMPTVCYLAAWHKPLRQLFFVPVLSLTGGCAWFTLIVFNHLTRSGVL